MRSISSGEQRSTLVQGTAKKKAEEQKSKMYKVFMSYRANFLHAQLTGKLASGIKRKK